MIVNPSGSGFQVPRLEIYATGNSLRILLKIYQARYCLSTSLIANSSQKIRITHEGLERYLKIDFEDEASLDVDSHPTS